MFTPSGRRRPGDPEASINVRTRSTSQATWRLPGRICEAEDRIGPSTRCNMDVCKARLIEFLAVTRTSKKLPLETLELGYLAARTRIRKGHHQPNDPESKAVFSVRHRLRIHRQKPIHQDQDLRRGKRRAQGLCEPGNLVQGPGRLPGCRVAADLRLDPFRGSALPSEHLAVAWKDMDWERNRFRVDSPKTGRLGCRSSQNSSRTWRKHGSWRPRVRSTSLPAIEMSARTCGRKLLRIIRRAGVDPWPKVFHNLRATRETESPTADPLHVVCTWIGHTQPAAKHYLQVTDADFDRAAEHRAELCAKPKCAIELSTDRALNTNHEQKTTEIPWLSAKNCRFF